MFAGKGLDCFHVVTIEGLAFFHALINRLQRLGAVGALWDCLDPFYGVIRIVGVGFGGVGTGDRGRFRAAGRAVEPLACFTDAYFFSISFVAATSSSLDKFTDCSKSDASTNVTFASGRSKRKSLRGQVPPSDF